jgi:hypothetical protein
MPHTFIHPVGNVRVKNGKELRRNVTVGMRQAGLHACARERALVHT